MEIRAVLFDCDGLMFNTEYESQKMWYRLAEEYDSYIPEEFIVAITGAKRDDDFLDAFSYIPHIREIMNEMRTKRFDLSYWKAFTPDGLNKKGLVELNHYLHEEKILTAVCSSSKSEYVKTLIDTVSEPLYFDCIYGGESVIHSKPHPEIFLKAAERLNIEPQYCLVLEDSKQGILAAKRAGMYSCFIQDTIVPDEEMKAAIEYRADDLSEVIDLIKSVKETGNV